jgi:hypothetical protein
MPIELRETINKIRADGQITPDEHVDVERVFDIAEKLACKWEGQRTMLENEHDSQFLKIIGGIIVAMATGLTGLLFGYGFDLVQIGIALMTVAGSFITAFVIALFKKYIPALVEPVKVAFDAVTKPKVIDDGESQPGP